MKGVDDRSLWRNHFDWLHQAGARGHVISKQTTKDVRHCGHSDCFHRVDWTSDLRRTAAEINSRSRTSDANSHLNWNRCVRHAVVVERVDSFVVTVGYRCDRMTHEPCGVLD